MCVVDIPTGRLTLIETDFDLSRLIPPAQVRSYARITPGAGKSAAGGTTPSASHSERDGGAPGSELVFRDADGRRIPFAIPAPGAPSTNAVENFTLSLIPREALPDKDWTDCAAMRRWSCRPRAGGRSFSMIATRRGCSSGVASTCSRPTANRLAGPARPPSTHYRRCREPAPSHPQFRGDARRGDLHLRVQDDDRHAGLLRVPMPAGIWWRFRIAPASAAMPTATAAG